jgi:Ala-tRNA(Pro) deacylase
MHFDIILFSMENVYKILDSLGISYGKIDHPAVYTVEESNKFELGIEGGVNKSLFLRNAKGDRHYLIMLNGEKRLDMLKLQDLLSETRLSFASPERLMKYLGLTPGSVSPFGLINDSSKTVIAVVDNELLKYQNLAFHPNINTQTLILKTDDFKKYLFSIGHKVLYLDL